MQPLIKRAEALKSSVDAASSRLQIDAKQADLAKLDEQLAVPEVWNDPSKAQELSKQAAGLRAIIEPWQTLRSQAADILELLQMGDESMNAEFGTQLDALESEFASRKKDLLFGGKYDDHDAIVRITAGVGGTDAQDWAEMLERMYLRWAEKSGMNVTTAERSTGEEAGIKTSVLEISGPFAYGKLRSEHGVHRLVRLSPFNSDNLRQTSFALVEVLPQIDAPDEVQLDEKDLKIDVYRAGGHGGQSVNTTDSAVRVTHIPTNTVVAIQNERSQLQNKETAMKILRSKLAQLQLEQHAESLSDLKAGESANWGSQIRNYVLHPYTMVKDTRTKYEDKDAKSVLDGKLDGFIISFLESVPE
ncbi:MAG TPA: peptide chain release factor 2 [Candidatus Saccharibacteria bacterium]|nr:peptide chain release factor 2 [Candidatus Saccharibacteria bacterium]HRK94360.1 peptide chain release factor 2 [Candidatus Saccharibacteria bacterium]